jgi:bacillopeptidase F (M6 metalloprotease family)
MDGRTVLAKQRYETAKKLIAEGMKKDEAIKKAGSSNNSFNKFKKGETKRPYMKKIEVDSPKASTKLTCLIGDADEIARALKGIF